MRLSSALILNDLAREVHNNAKKKGFWDEQPNIAEKIALMHSELSEALEGFRNDALRLDENCPEHLNTTIEFADCIIRILDCCEYYSLDIGSALFAKHEYNLTRPYRHGKNF